MLRKKRVIGAGIALVVVAAVAFGIASGASGPDAEVKTASIARSDLSVTVVAGGRVESGVRADVFPATAGTLVSVNVQDGARVVSGTVLASLDTEPLEAQALQARAAVAAAESQVAAVAKQEPTNAEIEAARAGSDAAWAGYEAALEAADSSSAQAPSSGDIAAAEAATQAARNTYQAAKSAYDLWKASIEASAAPSPEAIAELKNLEIAKDQAYAGYLQANSAEDQLRNYDGAVAQAQADAAAAQAYAGYLSTNAQQERLEGTSLSAEMAAAQASVDQARQALVVAEQALRGADLVAPIDGVVLFNALGAPAADGQTPTADKGAAVSPGAAPFTVVNLDGLTFFAEVDEVEVTRIETGMSALVSLDAFDERPIESEVIQIMPAATLTQTGGTVFPVYLGLDGAEESILIGMRGDAQIEVSTVPDALTVPVEALFDEGGVAYVYVIDGDVLQRTKVEIGTITETRVEVTSGVDEGDLVALSSETELVDGMTVRVLEE